MIGYKAFDKNLCCRGFQFRIGETYETGVNAKDMQLCTDTVFHYCRDIFDIEEVSNYTLQEARICEIIAGDYVTDDNKLKYGSNKITILREITGDEKEELINIGSHNIGEHNLGNWNIGNWNIGDQNEGDYNIGDNNIGYSNIGYSNKGNNNKGNNNTGNNNIGNSNAGDWNTGNYNKGNNNTGDMNKGYRNTNNHNTGNYNAGAHNTGNYNTGSWNTGDRNTGNANAGDYNTGDANTGDANTGNRNAGYKNTGNRNTGIWNTGDANTGDRNTGDYNTGDNNTGHDNTGDHNTGDRNTGSWNTGSWNTGSWNTGFFNTDTPTIRMFNKDTGLTYHELIENYEFPSFLNFRCTIWVHAEDASEREKQEHEKEIAILGGFLKQPDYKQAFRLAWDSVDVHEHEKLLKLPNWDNKVFKEISGIDAAAEIAAEKAKQTEGV